MSLTHLGLLLVVLASAAGAQADGGNAARPPRVPPAVPPAAPAASDATAASSAPPPRDPIEVRLAETWRWRQIHPPPDDETRFLLVRPWRDGGLIVRDVDGLRAFDGWTWRREPGWDRFRKKDVNEVVPMEDGLVAILGQSLVAIDRAGNAETRTLLERPHAITRSVRLPDGGTAIAAGDRVWRLASTALSRLEPLWELPEGATIFTAITIDDEERVWCCTDAGIFRRSGGGWEAVAAGIMPPTRLTQAFHVGSLLHFLPPSIDDITPGVFWDGERLDTFHDAARPIVVGEAALSPDNELVITMNTPALRVYRDGIWVDVRPPLSSVERIGSVCITAQRRLALVTSSGRLWVCDLGSRRWEAHDPSAAGLSPSIAAVVPSPSRGGLWIGTHSGVGRWDGSGFTDVHHTAGATGVPLRQVTGLAEDPRGRLWAGSGSGFHGALRLDGETWTRHDAEHEVGPRHVHVIRRIGDDLWFPLIGDEIEGLWYRGGAVRLRGDEFRNFPVADGSAMQRTYDVVRTRDGRLLAGTRHRLYELIDDAWHAWDIPLLEDWTAWALHSDEDGSLWMGLGLNEEGLIKVDPDGAATMLREGSWLHSGAAAFCRTEDDRLWFASVSGLFLVDGRDCHEISGRLPARNFWPVVADGSGGLWLGTLGSGLVHYVPDDHEAPRGEVPRVTFDLGTGHALLRCDATDRWNVTLPEQLRFRVWLDGRPVPHPGEWSGELRTHMIDLGRLPWGRHEVAFEAVDGLGNASERRSRAFDVEPPIWLRPPLLASMAAVAAALAWIFLAGRARRLERRQAQRAQRELAERLSVLARKLLSSQEDERKNISRELHDDLGQLLTAVCLDLERAGRSGDEERRHALQRGLATTRTALDRVRELSSLLRPPVLDDLGLEQAVNSLVDEFTTRTGVDVQLQMDPGLEPVPDVVAGQAFRIIQEALTNVARHALADTAFVTLHLRSDRLELTVADDGQGFDQQTVPLHRCFGLLGMRERAELLGGTFRLESTVGTGTRIHVSMPLPGTGAPRP